MSLAGVTSMTRWLNWSLISVLPLATRTARVGSGAELLPDSVLVRYSQTGASAAFTSTMRLLFASVISVLPLRSRLHAAACERLHPLRVSGCSSQGGSVQRR